MAVRGAELTLTPGEFLQLAGHPLRWRLLGELARSDRTVRELTDLVGEKQNLVSYHLGKLRDAGLVRMRRSSADGRDAYYTVDLVRFREHLAATAEALHPGLTTTPSPARTTRSTPVRVLFGILFIAWSWISTVIILGAWLRPRKFSGPTTLEFTASTPTAAP